MSEGWERQLPLTFTVNACPGNISLPPSKFLVPLSSRFCGFLEISLTCNNRGNKFHGFGTYYIDSCIVHGKYYYGKTNSTTYTKLIVNKIFSLTVASFAAVH